MRPPAAAIRSECVPVVAVLRAGVLVGADRHRPLPAHHTRVPDVGGLRVEHGIEVRPQEGMVECAVGEMVLVGKCDVRILGCGPRHEDLQRIIFEQVVGIERQDVVRRGCRQAHPHGPDDADVVDRVDHADERCGRSASDLGSDVVAHRTVAQDDPLVGR